MADDPPQNTLNLDLNLEPVVDPSENNEPRTMTFEEWIDRYGHRHTARHRFRSVWPPIGTGSGLNEPRNTALAAIGGNETPPAMTKMNDNDDEYLKNGDVGRASLEKSSENESGFFDCNICLGLASEPVVTCCGHLFCWPCLYRWLYVHSNAKECPVCKGEVTIKTVTPIYSRVNVNRTRAVEIDSNVKIPNRPQANRIESWQQSIHRSALNNPMFEMIRRLDRRFELTRDMIPDDPREIPSSSLLNRFMTSRGMRVGQERTETGSVDLVGSTLLSGGSNPGATDLNIASGLSFDEWDQEELPLMDDRHSFSSIAAIMQSESQNTDSAVEIDSRVSRRRRLN